MKNQTIPRVLAIIALVAVGIYSIHCKPAWNPEGNKVAHVYFHEQNGDTVCGIAIYDLATKENERIIEVQESGSGEEEPLVPIEVFWPKRGSELIYVSAPSGNEAGKIAISAYSLRTKEKKQIREVEIPGASIASSLWPLILEGKRWLWVAGEKKFYRIDMDRGQVREFKEGLIVLGQGKKLFFVSEGGDEGITFGRIRTLFRVKASTLFTVPAQEGQELAPIVAAPPEKQTQFAYLKIADAESTVVVVDRKGKPTKEIALPRSMVKNDPSHGLWNPEGTVLWLGTAAEVADGESRAVIAEIDIGTEAVKLIEFDEEKLLDDIAPLHFSLSPDRRHLACSVTIDEEIYLCVVDLTGEERTPVLIYPPGHELGKPEVGAE